MAFITEKEELKPGLILFRRGDVDHRMWYCRMKMAKADRYKTVSLKTTDISAARERAFDQDADVRFRIKHARHVLYSSTLAASIALTGNLSKNTNALERLVLILL